MKNYFQNSVSSLRSVQLGEYTVMIALTLISCLAFLRFVGLLH